MPRDQISADQFKSAASSFTSYVSSFHCILHELKKGLNHLDHDPRASVDLTPELQNLVFRHFSKELPYLLKYFCYAKPPTPETSRAILANVLSNDQQGCFKNQLLLSTMDMRELNESFLKGLADVGSIPNPWYGGLYDFNLEYKILFVNYANTPQDISPSDKKMMRPLLSLDGEGLIWHFCLLRLMDGNICPFFTNDSDELQEHFKDYHYVYFKFDFLSNIKKSVSYRVKSTCHDYSQMKVGERPRVGVERTAKARPGLPRYLRFTKWKTILARANVTHEHLIRQRFVTVPCPQGSNVENDLREYLHRLKPNDMYLEYEDPETKLIPLY